MVLVESESPILTEMAVLVSHLNIASLLLLSVTAPAAPDVEAGK